jgi:MOSC domain-containing protein YiiM
MRIQSLNVALPKRIEYKGEEVWTGICKQPSDARLWVRKLNIDGDEQADLTVHGGIDKAVYAFPCEHYDFYQSELDQQDYTAGQFGENLTTEGMLETGVRIGDRYRVGEVLFEVSQPRSPCYKFAIRMDSAEALVIMINSGRTGFYLRVLEEGEIGAGDAVELVESEASAPTVEDINRLYYLDRRNAAGLERALRCQRLARVFRDEFEIRLGKLEEKS